jgi:hypothetical protein
MSISWRLFWGYAFLAMVAGSCLTFLWGHPLWNFFFAFCLFVLIGYLPRKARL